MSTPVLSRYRATLNAMTRMAAVCGVLCAGANAAPPVYDHIVIVVEENHSFQNVIGNADAPFMNQLASQGMLCTNMYGLTHPSQPNYLHLFSGANQGVGGNGLSAGLPFNTPNLAGTLLAAGRTFTGYSEDLPSVGSNVEFSGQYWRKHNPWANWQVDPPTVPGPNQFSSALNRPFTDFPADYTLLPTVAIVVPNQDHDMHDGTIAMADAWLLANLGGYAAWCRAHNSLLVVTWDEDSFASRNQIPTIFSGPDVRVGTYGSRRTLHDLLATVCATYGVAAPGAAAEAGRMTGVFYGEPTVSVARFQQGANGYAGGHDTWIEAGNAAAAHGGDVQHVCDGSPESQVMLRFDDLFGAGPGRVPLGAVVESAKVSLLTGTVTGDSSGSPMSVHRMLVPFTESSTWDSLVGGVGLGAEAVTVREFETQPRTLDTWEVLDVTNSLRAWQAGAPNHGWVVVAGGGDGWRFASCEAAATDQRPVLEITYSIAGCGLCAADFDCSGAATVTDIFAFLSAWFAGDPRGDFNGTGGTNVQDIFDFLAAWFVGCS